MERTSSWYIRVNSILLAQVLKEIREVKYVDLGLDSHCSGDNSINWPCYTFHNGKDEKKKSATVQPKQASDNKIVVITVPQTIKAGSVSAMITIQIQDLKGNPVEVVSSTVVTLLSSSASGIFSANGNEPAIKAVTVSAGTNSANFYYKDPTKGNPDIIASKDGLAPGTQTETIN